MPDLGRGLAWLFWLACTLFSLSFVVGAIIPHVGRALPAVEERMGSMKTWAMRVALSLVLLAALVVTLAAGWYLTFACGLAGNHSPCGVSTTLWSGLGLPELTLPALSLTLYVDPLAALFVLLVGFFTACVAVYSFGWLAQDPERHNVAGNFSLFAGATLLVLVVNNAFWLLLVLELMSLSFGYLVLYRGKQDHVSRETQTESKTAARTYLIVSHVSTLCLGTAILLKGVNYDTFDLGVFRGPSDLSPLVTHLAFLFTLIGLGIRAGMTPFHFWVPVVHPQSPTTTHAFSLGVSIKVAIYLMIRFFFEFLNPIAWWWGALLLALAGLTAVISVFYALLSRDLKRALAYHSVENIGIILAGLGLALLFASEHFTDEPTVRGVVGLALIAALFHTFNHALFKGLLYLGTGNIENRTGTVVMEELGGLLRRFPWTGTTFLVGAVAIAGFPPFNGFISEWLTVQALFAGVDAYRNTSLAPVLIIVLPLTLILLAAAFAMTALAFVKIAGETLLGLPRKPTDNSDPKSRDVPWSMRSVSCLLASLCLIFGLMPRLLIPWLATAANGIGYDASALQATYSGLTIQVGAAGDELTYIATLAILPVAALVVLPLLAVLAAKLWRMRVPPRSGPVWAGGEPYQPQTMQYTGSALSALVWEPLERDVAKSVSEEPLPGTFRLSESRYVMEGFNRFYNGLTMILLRISTWLGDFLQNGDIRRYLLYIFTAFIVVLFLLAANG